MPMITATMGSMLVDDLEISIVDERAGELLR